MKILGITISEQLIHLLIVFIGGILLYFVIKMFLYRTFHHKLKKARLSARRQKTLYSLLNNILKYVFAFILLFIVLGILGVNTTAIIASLGVFGLVIGLSFQDIVRDFLAGIAIIFEDQFAVGDIVQITGFKGEVLAIGLKTTKLKSATGEIKILANRNIMEVINYSLGENIVTIDIEVAYDNEIMKIEKVINDLIVQISEKVENIKGDINYLGIQKLGDPTIYRLMVPTTVRYVEQVQSDVYKEIKNILDNNGIKRK